MTIAIIIFLTIYSFNSLVISECARILAVFPTPSISCQNVFRPIVQELAKKGHVVTVITTDPAFQKGEAPANLTEIDIHEVSYEFKKQIFATAANNNARAQVENIYDLLRQIFDAQLHSVEIKKLSSDQNLQFDLLLLEACVREAIAFSHVFKVPVIQISSFGTLEHNNYAVGSSLHPIYYPSVLYHRRVSNHSFQEKIRAVYNQYVFQEIVDSYEALENIMLRKHFGPELPSLNELTNNIDLLFLNVHPIWENNRPVPPNVIYLGGLPLKPEEKLPEDLASYLNASQHGVIFISFGTNANCSLLPVDKIRVFLKVFSGLPYDVLWKWDADELVGKPSNVRIGKWFPQPDLLRHPKLKLFITQGGLQSIDEAMIAGVPILGIPIWADQWFNMEKCELHGVGIKLEFEDVEEDILITNIKTIIGNKTYSENVAKFRSLLHDQHRTSLERAIYWTEYVIKHKGARHLRSPSANIAWTQHYEVDVVCFLLLLLVMIVTVVGSIIFVLIRLVMIKNAKVKSLY